MAKKITEEKIMGKIRVYELAKKLGIENKELILKLKSHGVEVKSSLSMIDENTEAVKDIKPNINKGNGSDNTEDEREPIREQKFISTEELTNKSYSGDIQKEKEKLSIFYRRPEAADEPVPVVNLSTNDNLSDTKPTVKKSGRGILAITFSFIGIAFSIVAIIIAITFASEVRILPQSITSLIRSNDYTSANKFNAMKLEIDRIRSDLTEERKLRLQRELNIVEHLSNRVKNRTKGQLEALKRDLSLLLQKLDEE